MTPNEINVLLHYHCSPTVHPLAKVPAIINATSNLVHWGLLANIEPPYTTTSKGVAHVKQLCTLPLPEQVWVSRTGEVL